MKNNFRFILVFYALVSCSPNPRDSIPKKFNLPEKPTHEVTKKVVFSQLSENDYLQFIWKLHILSDGNLLIQEANATRLIEVDLNESSFHIIGQEGRGPGEFLSIWSTTVTPNDTLHVFQKNSNKHQVFAKDAFGWKLIRENVIKNQNFKIEFAIDYPEKVYTDSVGRYLVKFQNDFTPHDTTTKLYNFIYETNFNLSPIGDIRRFEFVWDVAVSREKNRFVTMNKLMEFRRVFYLYDAFENKLILIQNNSHQIKVATNNQEPKITGYLPFERIRITAKKKEKILSDFQDYEKKRYRLIESKLLEFEPYYNHVVLDHNLLWVNINRKEKSKPNWVVTDLNGDLIKSFRIPEEIDHVKVHRNMICGVNQQNVNPTVLCYEINKN